MASPPSIRSFLLLTPLENWNGPDYKDLRKGVSIRKLADREKACVEESRSNLCGHELAQVKGDGYWLTYEFTGSSSVSPSESFKDQCESVWRILLSIQIVVPVGASNLLLLYEKKDTDLVFNDRDSSKQPYLPTNWGRRLTVPKSFRTDLPTLLKRLSHAFAQKIKQKEVPVRLLELGLQSSDRHIRVLLWTIGLDATMAASGSKRFSQELCNSLGGNSRICSVGIDGEQPSPIVRQIAPDLYKLRNDIAHGLPFCDRFKEVIGLEGLNGKRITGFETYSYDQILEECALFLLCSVLKKKVLV